MRIRNVLPSLKKHVSWKRVLVFGTALVVIIGTTFLQETTKQFLTWLLSTSPRVSYRVVSIERLLKHELGQYASRELRETFNLQLDDPIITRYDVFKLRIKNEGSVITGGFKLRAQVNQGQAKIVDIKHIIKFPVNKAVMIDYSLPNFTWRPLKSKSKVAFSWSSPSDTSILGYYLYKSVLKDLGYGNFNIGLIRRNCFVLGEEELPPSYYALVTVGLNGVLSNLSSPVKFPESVALQPRFKDVITIDPNFDRHDECLVTEERIYHSLSEALAKEGRKAIFLIRKRRADIQSSVEQLNEYGRDLRIFYEDDLDFLRGQAELSFPDGVDGEGEIDFYFVTKSFSDTEPSISLVLMGQPTVSFIRRAGNNEMAQHAEVANSTARKQALTPKLVTARTGKKTISLVWARNQSFKGIRVFRRAAVKDKETKKMDSLGEEIYDGKYFTGKFKCESNQSTQRVTTVEIKIPTEIMNPPPNDPPKRKHEIKEGIPAAPFNVKVSFTGGIEEPVNFFTDNDVRDKLTYKYTIYTFDNDGNYSYPVQINASLTDSMACNLVEEDKKK
jgi:hypothetical protein